MELRHLRYFIAVAEEGSLLTAAQRRLHTSQPSLSRQIRDLESEVGVKLLERQARGVTLTAAGKIFLDHARMALLQVEAGIDGARRTDLENRSLPWASLQDRKSYGYRTRCESFARRHRMRRSHCAVSRLRSSLLG